MSSVEEHRQAVTEDIERLTRKYLDDGQSLDPSPDELFEKFFEPAYTNAWSASVTAKAVVVLSGRLNSHLLRASDVADTEEEKYTINRAKRKIADQIGLTLPPMHAEELLPVFADRLSLSDEVLSTASHILEERPDLLDRSPSTLAAAALYEASFQHNGQDAITQEEIHEATDVSPISVRNTYRELSDWEE